MKAFKFTLQAVRTLREREEQDALTQYGRALREFEEAKQRLQEMGRELEAAWQQLEQALDRGAPAFELVWMQNYSDFLEQQETKLKAALEKSRAQANETFVKYLAARLQLSVVAKLAEKQKRGHVHEQRRREQKVLDDLAHRRPNLPAAPNEDSRALWN